jgi:asparagine synthase (glutamine-hydrolysing)
MCGIAGIYNFNSRITISKEKLLRMIGMIKHRGPDQQGIYLDDNVGLANARLSIIDLVSGDQPVHNEDKNLWIVYNGEIYNYPELKELLEQKGHLFYTNSDTEVLLHLYEEYGEDCLSKINGQFAFAIWNNKNKELFLARDRIGIRPLYYTISDNNLIFASEVKAIFVDKRVSREIDPIALDQIFTFWTTLSPRTAFKNIYELPPGYFLKVSKGKINLKKYWDSPFYPRSEQFNTKPAEICEQLRELMLDAIRIRLRSDVPVGCYLSGGLDSSAVTSLVVKKFNREVKTFGIRFEQQNFDEGRHQNQMVDWLKTNHSEINATNYKIGESLVDCLWHCEKPVLRTAPIPLFLLSQLVNQNGLKVVLTGEGADEVFGGYGIFKEAKVRRFCARFPDSQKRAGLFGKLYPYIFDNPRFRNSLQSFFTRGLDQVDDPVFSHLIRWNNTSRIKTFFSQELRHAIGSYDPYQQVRDNLPDGYENWDSFSKAQYLEMTIFLSNYLLSSQGDRVAMAHSVEIRLPYLDPRVMDFMAHVPAKWKILGLNEKHILKKTFENILPPEIAHRQKHPYRAPIKQSLLNNKTIDFTKEMLSESSLKESGLFDSDKVSKLLNKLQTTDNPSEVDSMALVGILSSQLIYRRFVENIPDESEHFKTKNLVLIDNRKKALQYNC